MAGELQASGFREPQWLIERGQRYVQITELAYRVAENIDGRRTLEEIAAAVTEATPWAVEPDQVRLLIERVLIPTGVVVAADGSVAPTAGTPSPLQVNMRMKVVGSRVINPVTGVLRLLFAPLVLALALASLVAGHTWLYVEGGLLNALVTVIYKPALFLPVLATVLLGAVFHELGHATAVRYGGGEVRVIGVGFYLIYPSLYTDTSDSYRMRRKDRVRVDLGGIYFELLFALAVIGLSLVTGWDFLLLAVLLINLDAVQQLVFPMIRFDAYWLLGDLTGVPDLFSAVRPFLRRLARRPGAKLPALKRWVTAVFTIYLAVTIPALGMMLYLFVARAPWFFGIVADSFSILARDFGEAFQAGNYGGTYSALGQMLILTLPIIGISYFAYSLARLVWKVLLRLSKAAFFGPVPTLWRPRVAAVLAGALVAAAIGVVATLHFGDFPTVPPGHLEGGIAIREAPKTPSRHDGGRGTDDGAPGMGDGAPEIGQLTKPKRPPVSSGDSRGSAPDNATDTPSGDDAPDSDTPELPGSGSDVPTIELNSGIKVPLVEPVIEVPSVDEATEPLDEVTETLPELP